MISFAAGLIGGVASAHADDFYRQLIRPTWAPPSWVFGPVWTLLYILMGVAAWLVWVQRNRVSVLPTLGLFLVQLAAGGEVYVARAQLRPGGSRAPNQALQQTLAASALL